VILFQYQSSWKIAIGGLVLIPDPSLKALSIGDNTRGTWIWDQSLMTVEINTIT